MKKLFNLGKYFHRDSLRQPNENKKIEDWLAIGNVLPELFPATVDPRQQLLTVDARQPLPLTKLVDADEKTTATKVVTAANLPYHTNDRPWLAKYIYRTMRRQGKKIAMGNAVDFVQQSSDFEEYRSAYEQRLVLNQILHVMRGGSNNVWLPAEHRDIKMRFDPDCDKHFRRAIMESMTGLGLDPEVVETGLETNAGVWRDKLMRTAFHNRYYRQVQPDGVALMPSAMVSDQFKDAHQAAWLRLREYEYYQDHHDIIDELELATPAMRLTPDQVAQLTDQVAQYHTICRELYPQVSTPERGQEA